MQDPHIGKALTCYKRNHLALQLTDGVTEHNKVETLAT
jgi:hypothetical protein